MKKDVFKAMKINQNRYMRKYKYFRFFGAVGSHFFNNRFLFFSTLSIRTSAAPGEEPIVNFIGLGPRFNFFADAPSFKGGPKFPTKSGPQFPTRAFSTSRAT